MKKPMLWLALIILVMGVFLSLRPLGILSFYVLPSTALEPGMPIGTYFMVSSLKPAHKHDFVQFTPPNDTTGVNYVNRMVADEGDTVQIINALLYINGNLIDDSTKLKLYFTCTYNYYRENQAQFYNTELLPDNGISAFFLATPDAVKHFPDSALCMRVFYPDTYRESTIYQADSFTTWNVDQFGPVVVPVGKVFLLGDNRSNSLDSRYYGFVDKHKISGSVVFHFVHPLYKAAYERYSKSKAGYSAEKLSEPITVK